VPVLPAKFDDRLLFPLCRKCAIDLPNGGIKKENKCQHTDEQRGWISTCTSIELKEALDRGYRVSHFYRGLEYGSDQWDENLFKNYVTEFYEMKLHASGFPEGVDEEEFIMESMEKFGVNVHREKMKANKAKRQIAKLMLNNLWGRYSLRNGMTSYKITDSPAVLREYLENKMIEVSNIDSIDDTHIMITFNQCEDFIEEHNSSNIILSLWTTAAARIHLLKALDKVVEGGGTLLYCDTDSIVFSYPEEKECPLQTGPHIGDLTDEYPDHDILEFLSGGCKNYAMKMRHKITGKEKQILRVRGITLSGDVCKVLHYDSFKKMIESYTKEIQEPPIMITYPNFIRPSIQQGGVFSQQMSKIYRPIVLKGVVTPDYIIKDFGSQ
jgi:hypothetical protein